MAQKRCSAQIEQKFKCIPTLELNYKLTCTVGQEVLLPVFLESHHCTSAAKASEGNLLKDVDKTSSPTNCVTLYLNGQNNSGSCSAEKEDCPDHLGGGEVPPTLKDVPDAVQGASHAILHHSLHYCIL